MIVNVVVLYDAAKSSEFKTFLLKINFKKKYKFELRGKISDCRLLQPEREKQTNSNDLQTEKVILLLNSVQFLRTVCPTFIYKYFVAVFRVGV